MKLFALFAAFASADFHPGNCAKCDYDGAQIKVTHLQKGLDGFANHQCFAEDDKYYTVCGGSQVCKNKPRVEKASSAHEVRCCSDKPIKNYNKFGSCKVWGESEFPQCIHAATWQQADAHCKADGARLCTKEELSNDCTRGSGCNHDLDMIWSSSAACSCECEAEQHHIACGGSQVCKNKPRVAKDTEKHEVRCCSDKAHKNYNKFCGLPVWGESEFPQCIHAATWQQAAAHCKADGARLCTVEELSKDCTRGSGCNHDLDMIWAAN